MDLGLHPLDTAASVRQVGDRLGRYTLLKQLAVGGMGEVFVAAKPGPVGFGPLVALKILRDELAGDPQFVDMLVDEANISMFLNHQNVVSVLDLSETEGAYYIAMEYVQGITVERLVDSLAGDGRNLDIPHTLYIAGELCRALKYAHTRVNHNGEPLNIIHRDVTPANILLSVQGEVKLTDFGIARARGRIHQTQAGVLKGKFGYMAPEMVRYERIDARADLFCAGVVMYLMMSGRHPVAGAAVMEAIQRFEQKRIPPPSHYNSDIPPALDAIVMRALEPQPDHRWGSAAALGDALRDVMLQNADWRNVSKDAGQRLSGLIQEVSPLSFDPPVDPPLLQKLLQEAADADADPAKDGAGAELPTDGAMPVLEAELGGSSADIETDEQLSKKEVLSAQEQLRLERGRSAVADLLEDFDSGGRTAASPVAEGSLVVDFPESSPGRPADASDMLAEPALPIDASGAIEAEDGYEATVAGYEFDEERFGEHEIDRPIQLDTDNEEQTIVSAPAPALAERSVSVLADHSVDGSLADGAKAAVAASSSEPGQRADDGKTVAGAFVPDAEPEIPEPVPRIVVGSRAPESDYPSDDDEHSTIVPVYEPAGETDRHVPMEPGVGLPIVPGRMAEAERAAEGGDVRQRQFGGHRRRPCRNGGGKRYGRSVF